MEYTYELDFVSGLLLRNAFVYNDRNTKKECLQQNKGFIFFPLWEV